MEEPIKTTEFNSALASLMRLHELLIDCNNCRRQCYTPNPSPASLKLWKITIEAIYSEIYPKTTAEQRKVINELFIKCNQYKELVYTKKINGEINNYINIKNFLALYNTLDLIEKELRTIADKKGMLIPEGGDRFGR